MYATKSTPTVVPPQEEVVIQIPLSELHPFPNHPFKVRDDDAMRGMMERVREYGVLTPAIIRSRETGGYEMIAGHRRKYASEKAGLETMPAIVREMDDDSAIILMVDSNIQRENILPSEKAAAYKMKMAALKRKAGRPPKENSGQVGRNFKGKETSLMAGPSVAGGVYSFDATAGDNQRWVMTAEEFQEDTGISDTEKDRMFNLSSSSWSSGWLNGDYTSMWGTDPQPVTPENLYTVYQPNKAFLYLLNRLSERGTANPGWSEEDAIKNWSSFVQDDSGNLRTRYRIIVETGAIITDPDGYRRAMTLRDVMAYTLYNDEPNTRYHLIYDQTPTEKNMAQWMRQAITQFVEYPLSLSTLNGMRGTYAMISKGENRFKNLILRKPSVRKKLQEKSEISASPTSPGKNKSKEQER